MTNYSIQTVDFHGQPLLTIEQDGTHYTAMKPICDNIGLQWDAQFRRIKRDEVLSEGIAIMAIPSGGGEQKMLCLPIEYLNGWLFGIDVKRVKAEIRETLIMYKRECYQALYNYWHKGQATNPRFEYSVNPSDTLTLEQGDALRDMLRETAEKLPKASQGKFMVQGWSKLKAHFGVKYRDIPQSEYAEALSIISRHSVEALHGELLPRQENQYTAEKARELRVNGIYLLDSGFAQYKEQSGQIRKAWDMAADMSIMAERIMRLLGTATHNGARVYTALSEAQFKLCHNDEERREGREKAAEWFASR
ncbi:phage antirepressor N-terminal domain-containing protein [Cardiobacteriaceae bacterium TAE3-ERU3]|nr:phage antirepressor N-terminal domain-containing protein [Cardiobacteriaceae bacterium TAE3-ERU3]